MRILRAGLDALSGQRLCWRRGAWSIAATHVRVGRGAVPADRHDGFRGKSWSGAFRETVI